jgi:hypothetical protein
MPAFVWEINFALWIMIGCAAMKVTHLVQCLKSQSASESVAQASTISHAISAIAHTLKKQKSRNRGVHPLRPESAVGPSGTISVLLTEPAVGPWVTVSVGSLISQPFHR